MKCYGYDICEEGCICATLCTECHGLGTVRLPDHVACPHCGTMSVLCDCEPPECIPCKGTGERQPNQKDPAWNSTSQT